MGGRQITPLKNVGNVAFSTHHSLLASFQPQLSYLFFHLLYDFVSAALSLLSHLSSSLPVHGVCLPRCREKLFLVNVKYCPVDEKKSLFGWPFAISYSSELIRD